MNRRLTLLILIFSWVLLSPVAAAERQPVSIPSRSQQPTISMPLAAAMVVEQTEISAPTSPITQLSRSRRTISQSPQPTPHSYAHSALAHWSYLTPWRYYLKHKITVCFTSERIAYPFHAFW